MIVFTQEARERLAAMKAATGAHAAADGHEEHVTGNPHPYWQHDDDADQHDDDGQGDDDADGAEHVRKTLLDHQARPGVVFMPGVPAVRHIDSATATAATSMRRPV